MISRRGFLTSLTAALATAALDPERLLWVPGQKTIFDLSAGLPRIEDVPAIVTVTRNEVIAFTLPKPVFRAGEIVTVDGMGTFVIGRPEISVAGATITIRSNGRQWEVLGGRVDVTVPGNNAEAVVAISGVRQ